MKITSTKWVTIPEGVTAERVPKSRYALKGFDTAYHVFRDGTPVGYVGSRRRQTYRRYAGDRARYPAGHATDWGIAGDDHGGYSSRAAAIAALLQRGKP